MTESRTIHGKALDILRVQAPFDGTDRWWLHVRLWLDGEPVGQVSGVMPTRSTEEAVGALIRSHGFEDPACAVQRWVVPTFTGWRWTIQVPSGQSWAEYTDHHADQDLAILAVQGRFAELTGLPDHPVTHRYTMPPARPSGEKEEANDE